MLLGLLPWCWRRGRGRLGLPRLEIASNTHGEDSSFNCRYWALTSISRQQRFPPLSLPCLVSGSRRMQGAVGRLDQGFRLPIPRYHNPKAWVSEATSCCRGLGMLFCVVRQSVAVTKKPLPTPRGVPGGAGADVYRIYSSCCTNVVPQSHTGESAVLDTEDCLSRRHRSSRCGMDSAE